MSLPDVALILSPQAEEDFTDILQYTLNTWSEAQTYAYRAILDKALLAIQQYPQIGQVRPELSAAHRLFPAGHHIIVYRVKDNTVYVSRILHERMDITRHI
ncbi:MULTISPECIES: type II toxin-antitoxin system RelE/ParE family toxin [Methylomicrobium]|uniref:Toxin n=1 Tax=Methylomicrobium album BG8 TaxID=686340 RepID=H8GGW3_METAL|nr:MULTISPECIES: type II toxin-antitoxin system RelE/ParE family toxin [Methylomicrobium]EIC30076.1 plasmid stabilization system protein [Methylomicrobium album BG8]